MAKTEYLIGLGSNQRHHRHGRPKGVLEAAIRQLNGNALSVRCISSIIASYPIGPSSRIYANAAVIVESDLDPLELLLHLKEIESRFGNRNGQRWSKRVLDLDIILSADGLFHSTAPNLCIPHYALRQRLFVLGPAAEIAPQWRDPITSLTIRHLLSRLKRAKPLDPKQKRY
ncbi:MAG: 2-amino-4-hydroxy-6-hydroxymethyldihydropteridine diphosphokinase [Parasphingorhabdus sp.]